MAQSIPAQEDAVENEEFEYLKEQPQEDIKCPVCLEVLKDAHEIPFCGHVFCKDCIMKTKSQKK